MSDAMTDGIRNAIGDAMPNAIRPPIANSLRPETCDLRPAVVTHPFPLAYRARDDAENVTSRAAREWMNSSDGGRF